MDMITQRFIAISNRLLLGLRGLRADLQQLIGAIRDQEKRWPEQQNAAHNPPPERTLLAELTIPDSVQRQKRTSDNRQLRVQLLLMIGTWLAVIAAVTYAAITYGMWGTAQEALMEGRETTKQQLAKLDGYISEAEKANQLTIEAGRPWIGTVQPPQGHPDVSFEAKHDAVNGKDFMSSMYVWYLKNTGRRPARLEKVLTTGRVYKSCTETPDYSLPKGVTTFPFVDPNRQLSSQGVVVPDSGFASNFGRGLSLEEWQSIEHEEVSYCVTAVRLKVEENQLVGVFGEIGIQVNALKGA